MKNITKALNIKDNLFSIKLMSNNELEPISETATEII